jgi:small-conductance mechanosensitive channel
MANVNLLDDPLGWLKLQVSQWLDALRDFLPDLLTALVLLVIGWLGALVLRWLVLRFGRGMDALLAAVYRQTGQSIPRPRWSISTIVAQIAFWLVIAFTVVAAAERVGLLALASWLSYVLGYLPRVLIGGLILFIGYLIGNGLRNLVVTIAEARSFEHSIPLGNLVAALVMAFALLLALGQLGLDTSLLANLIVILAAAALGAAALAFGIGAGDSVRNIMASHYLRKFYEPGQRVRVQELEGEILEMTPVAVMLDTEQGTAMIPARRFLEEVSVSVEAEEAEGG